MAELKFLSTLRTSADQIKTDARTYIARVYKRANTLFTEASPFAQIISVMAELGELIMFYVEDSLVEQNIYTAQQPESIYGISRLTGHDATRGFAATGEIEFKWAIGSDLGKIAGTGLNIDARSELKCELNGLVYTLLTSQDKFRLEKSNKYAIKCAVVQGKFEKQTFTGTGESMQSYNIQTSSLTDHSKVSVSVNGEKWTKHDSMYDLLNNEKAYILKTGISGGLDVYFGTGNFGAIPSSGNLIEVEYIKHAGFQGNLDDAQDIIFKWDAEGDDSNGDSFDLNEYLELTVTSSPKMGADKESVEFTKLMAPLASKSYVLATPDNYEYFLSRYGMFSYVDAYNTTEDQYLDDDNVIYIFAIPDARRKLLADQDYFSIPINEMFFDQNEYDKMSQVIQDSGQQMVTTEVVFVKPKIRKYSMDINIRYFEGYTKQEIFVNVRRAVSDYMLNITRRDKLPKTDIV